MIRQRGKTDMEKFYEEVTIPENHFRELMKEYGVTSSKAKVISKSLTLYVLDTLRKPVHEINKRFDSYTKRNEKNRRNFLKSNNSKNKIDYVLKIHKLDINNLPKNLLKYKTELGLFI